MSTVRVALLGELSPQLQAESSHQEGRRWSLYGKKSAQASEEPKLSEGTGLGT